MTRKNEFANSVADDFPDIMSALDADGLAALQEAAGGAVSGGSGLLQVATMTLTDAQIKALGEVPVEVIPAPGANKLLLPISAVAVLNCAAGAYTGLTGTPAVVLWYENQDTIAEGYATSFPWGHAADHQDLNMAVVAQNGPNENNAIVITMTSQDGDLANGHADNTLNVTVYYVIVDL